jgi:anti-anti-sigma factor
MSTTTLFEVEREGDVVVVTPTANLGESEYRDIEAGGRGVLDLLAAPGVRGVVLDFRRTDYYGSTALGFFLRLWKRVCASGGRMAFCNVSDHEREILTATRLDTLWPLCGSREEALRQVRG